MVAQKLPEQPSPPRDFAIWESKLPVWAFTLFVAILGGIFTVLFNSYNQSNQIRDKKIEDLQKCTTILETKQEYTQKEVDALKIAVSPN